MGGRSRSARSLLLLPFLLTLLAALGWTGLRVRGAADERASPRPAGARPSPAIPLRFEQPTLRLGRLAPGERREANVDWRFEGAGPRRVLGVEAGCGCVRPHELPPDLARGDAGVLRLDVHAPRRSGPFRARVKVWLHPASGPEPPGVEVRGHVGTRVGVRPSRLPLGRRTAGSEIERRLEAVLDPDLSGATLEARLEGLDGAVAVEPSVFAGREGGTLRVRMRAPTTPGPFAGRIVVGVAGTSEEVEAVVTGEAVVRR